MKSKKTIARTRNQSGESSPRGRVDNNKAIILDFVLRRIEIYNSHCGGGIGVRKDSRGYTLFHEDGGTPLARLKPHSEADGYQIYYWSPFRRRWQNVDLPGGLALPLDEALDFIADDPMDCFWY